ncbi:hypothetical protein OESDEN_19813 [Oesophagostomum dentatum]|uniref:Uncharacterized protein n=1 Tax=Oesophagostomum dentatum TaxID=61180 RepID=A0A0B1SAF0_OESDE|nr:hypothetical protein OESDEN_19813 [Oesophagostomum dentatum]
MERERDGEMLSQLCDLLDTDMLQIVNVVKDIKQQADRITDGNRRNDAASNQGREDEVTGVSDARDWRPSTVTSSVEAIVGTSQQMSLAMLNCIQSLSWVDPGVYGVGQNESFSEFIRRFKRKYGRVVTSDKALVEILGDGHLDGRAKSMFLSLPESVKKMDLENVVEEMGR